MASSVKTGAARVWSSRSTSQLIHSSCSGMERSCKPLEQRA
jgi:hypothetical protein